MRDGAKIKGDNFESVYKQGSNQIPKNPKKYAKESE